MYCNGEGILGISRLTIENPSSSLSDDLSVPELFEPQLLISDNNVQIDIPDYQIPDDFLSNRLFIYVPLELRSSGETEISEDTIDNRSECADPRFREFLLRANLEENENTTQQWLDAVHSHLANGSTTSALEMIEAIVRAYDDLGLSYEGAPGPDLDDDHLLHCLRRPHQVLESRVGDCRENSLLGAITFSMFGFEPFIFITPDHFITGLILEQQETGSIPLSDIVERDEREPDLYLLPVSFDFTNNYSLDFALEEGIRFFHSSVQNHLTIIIDMNGCVIFENGEDENRLGRPENDSGFMLPLLY